VQRNPIQEWPERKHDEYKKRRPAKAPIPAGFQPWTEATARTIVSASTASTSALRNAVVIAGATIVQVIGHGHQIFLIVPEYVRKIG
jgi:hypothetical protein